MLDFASPKPVEDKADVMKEIEDFITSKRSFVQDDPVIKLCDSLLQELDLKADCPS